MRQNTYMNHVWSAREVKEEKSIEASNAITPGYTHHFLWEFASLKKQFHIYILQKDLTACFDKMTR